MHGNSHQSVRVGIMKFLLASTFCLLFYTRPLFGFALYYIQFLMCEVNYARIIVIWLYGKDYVDVGGIRANDQKVIGLKC